MKFGTTFSERYAHSLDLRPAAVYRALVSETGIEMVRLCVYWDKTEPQPGKFDFGSLDRQVAEAASAGLDIILAIGQKAPRWPEFHIPPWTSRDDPDFERQLLRMLETSVRHFRDSPISVWKSRTNRTSRSAVRRSKKLSCVARSTSCAPWTTDV